MTNLSLSQNSQQSAKKFGSTLNLVQDKWDNNATDSFLIRGEPPTINFWLTSG